MTDEEIRRERIKLRATYLNNVAVGVVTAGVLAPMITLALRDSVGQNSLALAFFISVICAALSGVIHLYAVDHLKELRT